MNFLKLISATLLVTLSAPAFANYTIVACYGDTAQGTVSFDTNSKYFTYIYGNDTAPDVSFDAHPETSWADGLSSVSVQASPGSITFKAQIINGDAETPLIDTSAEITVTQNADQEWILTSGSVFHYSQPYSLDGLIGHKCYVQGTDN